MMPGTPDVNNAEYRYIRLQEDSDRASRLSGTAARWVQGMPVACAQAWATTTQSETNMWARAWTTIQKDRGLILRSYEKCCFRYVRLMFEELHGLQQTYTQNTQMDPKKTPKTTQTHRKCFLFCAWGHPGTRTLPRRETLPKCAP